MIYDKISKQFIDMNPNQIGSETDRFVVLNEEQIQRANKIISAGQFDEDYILTGEVTAPTLEYLKQVKLGELNTAYIDDVNAGYFDSDLNITIKKADADISLFNKQLAGVQLLNSLNQAPYSVTLIDINSQIQSISNANYLNLMARYFLHNQTLFFNFKSIENVINLAQNESELDSIVIEFD